MKKTEIFVTRSSLPALEEFIPYLEKLWKSRFLTNMGEFHEELRGELKAHLGVKEVELFTNGHLALEFLLECHHPLFLCQYNACHCEKRLYSGFL